MFNEPQQYNPNEPQQYNPNEPQQNPMTLIDPPEKERAPLIRRWYMLTSLPDAPEDSTFLRREAVRRSRLSSSVIFFFAALVLSLAPVTYLVISIYPTYFWLTLGLFIVCIFALMLNRRGFTNTAGWLVTFGSFITLTAALFSTVPFDETTLQGYDMFCILLLLAAFLLPPRTIIIFFLLCTGVIIGSLLKMPLSPTLKTDLDTRLLIVMARPIGTLVVVGGIAFIGASSHNKAIERAYKAEAIVALEQEKAQFHQNLAHGIEKILETLVLVSNGNFSARAPLSEDNVLWQIARALNNLLWRFQRAMQSDHQLRYTEQAIQETIQSIQEQEAKHGSERHILPFTKAPILNRLIAALQGQSFGYAPPSSIPEHSATSNIPRGENALSPYRRQR